MIWYHRGIGIFFGLCGLMLIATLWVCGQWATVSWSHAWGADRTVFVESWNSSLVLGSEQYADPYSWPERYGQTAPSLKPHRFYGAFLLTRPFFSPPQPHRWFPQCCFRRSKAGVVTLPFETVSLIIPCWLILLCYPAPCYLVHLLLMRRRQRLRSGTPDVRSA